MLELWIFSLCLYYYVVLFGYLLDCESFYEDYYYYNMGYFILVLEGETYWKLYGEAKTFRMLS